MWAVGTRETSLYRRFGGRDASTPGRLERMVSIKTKMTDVSKAERSAREDFAYFNDSEMLRTTLAGFLTLVCSDADVEPETLIQCLKGLSLNLHFFLSDVAGSCLYCDKSTHLCLCEEV